MSSFKEEVAKFELECELENRGYRDALKIVRELAEKELADVEEGLTIPDDNLSSETAKSLRAYQIGKKEVWEDVLKLLDKEKAKGW